MTDRYKEGYRAGLEAAAKECDEQAAAGAESDGTAWSGRFRYWMRQPKPPQD